MKFAKDAKMKMKTPFCKDKKMKFDKKTKMKVKIKTNMVDGYYFFVWYY